MVFWYRRGRGMQRDADPIAALFPAGVPRWDWDATRLDGLYLDTAMTQPLSALGSNVAALGSPIAAIRDQWGGPALVQATLTKRALFGRRPPQIRQLLANSAFVGAVSGTPGTAPTGWSWQLSTGTLVAPGDGTLTFSGTAARLAMAMTVALAASETKTFSAKVDANPNGLTLNQLLLPLNGPVGVTLPAYANGALVNAASYIPVAGDRISYAITTTGTAGNITLRLGLGCTTTATGSVTLSEPQFENGSSRTAYQRSAGIHDVTEVGQPDIWGLRKDGTDDAYASASPIALGTDEVCVLASIYKMSDAAGAQLVELGPTADSTNGSFYIGAPSVGGQPYFTFAARGSSATVYVFKTDAAAPFGAVLAAASKAGAPAHSIRVNGVLSQSSTQVIGAGNFSSQTLYVGGRTASSKFLNGWFDRLTIGAALPAAAALQRAERHLGARSRITVA